MKVSKSRNSVKFNTNTNEFNTDNLNSSKAEIRIQKFKDDEKILKRVETKKFRNQVRSAQILQDGRDFVDVANTLEDRLGTAAVYDLAISKVPLLEVNYTKYGINTLKSRPPKSNNPFNEIKVTPYDPESTHFLPSIQTAFLIGNSSILKSLNSLPRAVRGTIDEVKIPERLMTYIKKTDIEITQPKDLAKKETKDLMKEEARRNKLLVAAIETMNASRTILDASRLLFESAIMFDELDMKSQAINCFEKATRRVDAEVVVRTYDLPITKEYLRKIERMSDFQKDDYVAKRNALVGGLVYAEEERQRLRAIISNCQLFRLYLQTMELEKAHKCLTLFFKDSTTVLENSELLWYAHSILREFSASGRAEVSIDQQIIRGSAGPLAEAHINILHELLEEDGRNPEVLNCLGLRYAEKCNFAESKMYYKRARDLSLPYHNPSELIKTWQIRKEVDYVELNRSLNKHFVERYDTIKVKDETIKKEFTFDKDTNKDKSLERAKPHKKNLNFYQPKIYLGDKRDDYSWFQGKHNDSSTILYKPPSLGWEAGTEAVMEKEDAFKATM